jgi:NAD(P)-dependent dehydrogenase (short-subunit alcohol dehydrogenase family)
MFPRERVVSSLAKYKLPYRDGETVETLRARLAQFYANRTLLKEPILPDHCAEAIVWLASDSSARTSGNVIPVDGGLAEVFLR